MHSLLSSNHFTQWFDDNKDLFDEGIDYQSIKVKLKSGHTTVTKHDYALTLDCAKEMAMLSRVEKGKVARKYFIACEKKLREVFAKLKNTNTRRSKLLAAGKSLEFVEKRIETVETRKTFTGTLKDHGVEGSGYQTCTRSIYAPLFGGDGSTAYIKEKLGIDKKASVRDSIGMTELVAVQLSELLAADRIAEQDARGNVQCANVCANSSRSVASAINASRKQLTA